MTSHPVEYLVGCIESGRLQDIPDLGDGLARETLIAALEEERKTATGDAPAGSVAAPSADSFRPLVVAVDAYSRAKMALKNVDPIQSDEVRQARVCVAKANQNLLKAQTQYERNRQNKKISFFASSIQKATAVQVAASIKECPAKAHVSRYFLMRETHDRVHFWTRHHIVFVYLHEPNHLLLN